MWNISSVGEVMKIFIKSEIEARRFGSNIQVARKRRKMSLVELSTKSSVSKTALVRIESGDCSVGFGKILNVLEALGLLNGLSEFTNPEIDRDQTIKEIVAMRESRSKSKSNDRNVSTKKSNLVRFT